MWWCSACCDIINVCISGISLAENQQDQWLGDYGSHELQRYMCLFTHTLGKYGLNDDIIYLQPIGKKSYIKYHGLS